MTDSRPKLVRWAKSHGIEDATREILWLTNAHHSLTAFVTVATRLGETLRTLEALPGSPTNHSLSHWIPICDHVIGNADDLCGELGAWIDQRPSRADDNPLLGICARRNPLYTALWSEHETEYWRGHYRDLVAHVLVAHVHVAAQIPRQQYESYMGKEEIGNLHVSAYGASLMLRRLSLAEREHQLERYKPRVSIEVFAEEAREYARLRRHSTRKADPILTYVARAYGSRMRRPQGRRGGSGGRVTGFVPFEEIADEFTPLDPDDPVYDGPSVVRLTEVNLGGDKSASEVQGELVDLDLDPEEFASVEVYAQPPDCESGIPYQQQKVLAKARTSHLSREHQHFPWRYQQLSTTEIHWLQEICDVELDRLSAEQVWSATDVATLEAVAAIQILLWTGRDLETVVDTVYVDIPTEDVKLGLVLSGGEKQNEWLVRAVTPKYASGENAAKKLVRTRTTHLHLPDIANASRGICLLRERGTRSSKPFVRSKEAYGRMVREFLRSRSADERITVAKISGALFGCLLEVSGDCAAADAITGRGDPLARVRHHYATPEVADLRNLYVQAVSMMYGGAVIEKRVLSAFIRSVRDEARYVGARFCAATTAVVEAVGELQSRIHKASRYTSASEFAIYHNLYTIYTAQMFAYATGIRAVTSPILRPSKVSEDGLLLFSDKDDGSGRKSRIAWVPRLVRLQVMLLERLQHQVLANLGEDDDGSSFVLLSADGGRTEPLRPRAIELIMRGFLALPPNAHRRFMRNELRERGCPMEVVEAFMGHWSCGEHPWAGASSMAVVEYARIVAPYIEGILDSLGFRLIRSRPVGPI